MTEAAGSEAQAVMLYHFCRLRMPAIALSLGGFQRRLHQAHERHANQCRLKDQPTTWKDFLENLHALDLFLACACLEHHKQAWEQLWTLRASRTDSVLVDSLRRRAIRLLPRNAERQEEAVLDFWGYLLAGEKEGSPPILARYDGQRPLAPWLIRVFQNKILSDLRRAQNLEPLPQDDVFERDHPLPASGEDRWYHEFREAAREWLSGLSDQHMLLIGLRWRYKESQREVAKVLNIHEGNVTRRMTSLSEDFQSRVAGRLRELGWEGEENDLHNYIHKEMQSLLLDEPRLALDQLAALLAGARLRKKTTADGNGRKQTRRPGEEEALAAAGEAPAVTPGGPRDS